MKSSCDAAMARGRRVCVGHDGHDGGNRHQGSRYCDCSVGVPMTRCLPPKETTDPIMLRRGVVVVVRCGKGQVVCGLGVSDVDGTCSRESFYLS